MKKSIKKTVELKNRYHQDIVYCDDIDDVINGEGYVFIKVYRKENPSRIFLVNKDAFLVNDDK